MLRWQAATLVFLMYLLGVALLPRRLKPGAGPRIFIGLVGGTVLLAVSMRLPLESFLNVWIFPGALLLVGYWTSGLLFVAPMPRAERWLAGIDGALHVQQIATRCPRAIAELLEFAYSGIYALVLVALGIALHYGVSADRFWTTVLVTDYICFGMLPWFQTRPPRALGFEVPWRSGWRRVNQRLLDAGSIQVNTFPSGHAAEALAAALLVLDAPAPLVIWMFLNMLLVSAGTVLGRYHYAADALAGWAVALAVFLLW